MFRAADLVGQSVRAISNTADRQEAADELQKGLDEDKKQPEGKPDDKQGGKDDGKKDGKPGDSKDQGRAPTAPATVVVTLPADATLTIDGQATTTTSGRRVFVSPELKPGREYTYTMSARVVRDGQPQTQAREVTVLAGSVSAVTFEFPSGALASR